MEIQHIYRNSGEVVKVGDTVIYLCGVTKEMDEPNKRPVCCECVDILLADFKSLADAHNVMVDTLKTIDNVLVAGAQKFNSV